MCEDLSVAHGAVSNEEKVSPKGSMANEVGIDAFKMSIKG